MMDLFNPPISKRKVRENVFAYKYRTGVIIIGEERYIFYSMADAIRKWRGNNSNKAKN